MSYTVIKVMRGQAVIRELTPRGPLWLPTTSAREQNTHVGRVLALGAPARTEAGAEVDVGVRVGDVVQYHYRHHQQAHTLAWEDGRAATWVPQDCLDAVIIDSAYDAAEASA